MSFATLLATTDGAVVDLLGGTIGYTSEAGETVSVSGVFDAAYVLVDAGQAGVSSTVPAVFLRLADLPSDPSDDNPTITVGSSTYGVREAKPDGLGGVLLLLHAV